MITTRRCGCSAHYNCWSEFLGCEPVQGLYFFFYFVDSMWWTVRVWFYTTRLQLQHGPQTLTTNMVASGRHYAVPGTMRARGVCMQGACERMKGAWKRLRAVPVQKVQGGDPCGRDCHLRSKRRTIAKSFHIIKYQDCTYSFWHISFLTFAHTHTKKRCL